MFLVITVGVEFIVMTLGGGTVKFKVFGLGFIFRIVVLWVGLRVTTVGCPKVELYVLVLGCVRVVTDGPVWALVVPESVVES